MWQSASAAPGRRWSGSTTEVTGNLTRLQAAQDKLVEAERMATVGRLSLKMAHEVRNPIAAIELNAELSGRHRQRAPRIGDGERPEVS